MGTHNQIQDIANAISNSEYRDGDLDTIIDAITVDSVKSDGTVQNIIEVTQEEYNALDPDDETLYIIVG